MIKTNDDDDDDTNKNTIYSHIIKMLKCNLLFWISLQCLHHNVKTFKFYVSTSFKQRKYSLTRYPLHIV